MLIKINYYLTPKYIRIKVSGGNTQSNRTAAAAAAAAIYMSICWYEQTNNKYARYAHKNKNN
jgi:hypothetical protein